MTQGVWRPLYPLKDLSFPHEEVQIMSDPVVFLDAEGNEISNDPRWHAKKLLKQQEDAAKNLDAEDESTDLEQLTGAELKELAKTEGIDISGLTKVSEVREAIRTALATGA